MQNEDINLALFEISNAVNTTSDLDELFQKIHQSLGKIVDTRNFFIALYNPIDDYIQFPYFVDEKSSMKQGSGYYASDRPASMTLRIIESGEPLLLDRQTSIEYCKKQGSEPSGPVAEIWIGVPLKIKKEVIGVLAVQSYTDPKLYSSKDVILLNSVSDQIALAIERKRSEEELRDRERLISVLYRLSNALHTTKKLDHYFKIIHESLGNVIDAENFTIALYDRDNDILHFEYTSDRMDHTMLNPVFSVSETSSLSYQVIKKEQTLLLNETEKNDLYKALSGKMIGTVSAKTWLGVPLRGKSEILGVVILQNYDRSNCYSKREVKLLESVSDQIAFAIEYKKAEQELVLTQMELVEKAHKAGMTDVASDSIHNIGNILNSVKTSNDIISNFAENSGISGLYKAINLLKENRENIREFLSEDPKGVKLIDYLLSIQEPIYFAINQIREQSERITDKIGLMTNVIHAQQEYASGGYMEELVHLPVIVDNILGLHANSLQNYEITVQKEYDITSKVSVQKTKLSHVLMNLISNAKDSMVASDNEDRLLVVSLNQINDSVFLKIKDNGIGIEQENLKKIFNHGFTTKPEGHGFGLHNSANFITEMKGSIWAESEGLNHGACFVLKFPIAEQQQ